jgi:hypothetical protein
VKSETRSSTSSAISASTCGAPVVWIRTRRRGGSTAGPSRWSGRPRHRQLPVPGPGLVASGGDVEGD